MTADWDDAPVQSVEMRDKYELPRFVFDTGDQTWKQAAACRGMGPSLFYPDRGDAGGVAEIRRLCGSCPVQAECAHAGLYEKHGIWGGTVERQRRRTRGEIADRPLRPIEHGTPRGYAAHRRRNEVACDACKEAHVSRVREYKRRYRRKAA